MMTRRTGKWATVYTWMKAQVENGEYVDCDEVQLTLLGEATMHHFDAGFFNDDELDTIDDLAYEVSEWYDKQKEAA